MFQRADQPKRIGYSESKTFQIHNLQVCETALPKTALVFSTVLQHYLLKLDAYNPQIYTSRGVHPMGE